MEELQCQENQIPERRKGPEASGSGQTAHGRPASSWGMIPALESRSESPFTERTQKEVRQKLAQAVAAVDNKAYREPCKMTLGEWLDIWAVLP